MYPSHCENDACLDVDKFGRCSCPCLPCVARTELEAARAEETARDIRAEECWQESREESV